MGGSDGKDEGNEDNGEEGEGYGREALILPDGHDDAFLSVILVPGHRRSIYGERHAAYWRGGARTSDHLRWALHRGAAHGCQPSAIWRTPYVGGEACPDLIRYLSQAAWDAVRGMGGGSVVVYIVPPPQPPDGDCHSARWTSKDQIERIRNLWRTASASSDGTFGASCAVLRRDHFDERTVCRPPRSLNPWGGGDGEEDNGKAEGSRGGEVPIRLASVAQLAALRGAGLLHGYPAFVLDCQPGSISGICTDETGRVLGAAGGEGPGPSLGGGAHENPAAAADLPVAPSNGGDARDKAHEEENETGNPFQRPQFEAAPDETRNMVWAEMGARKREVLTKNITSFVTKWTYLLNLKEALEEDDASVELEKTINAHALRRLERIANNLYGREAPIFHSLYERQNESRSVVVSGIDADLAVHIVGSRGSRGKGSASSLALNNAWRLEDKDVHFPFDDSPSLTFMQLADFTGEARLSAMTWTERSPLITSRHLVHYGVSACIMAHFITRQFRDCLIGKRIAKRFFVRKAGHRSKKPNGCEDEELGDVFRGSIADIHFPAMDDTEIGLDYWYIVYDDGDSEHVAQDELIAMLELYSTVGEEGDKPEDSTKFKMTNLEALFLSGKNELSSAALHDANLGRNAKRSVTRAKEPKASPPSLGRRKRRR